MAALRGKRHGSLHAHEARAQRATFLRISSKWRAICNALQCVRCSDDASGAAQALQYAATREKRELERSLREDV